MKSLLSACLLCVLFTPALAAGPTEAEQRRACMGDAFHFCGRLIGNRTQVTACMIAHHDVLSPGCRAVYDATIAANGH